MAAPGWQLLAGSSSVSWSGRPCGAGEQRPVRWRVCAPFYCSSARHGAQQGLTSLQSKTGSQSTWRQAGSLPAYLQSQKQAVGGSGIRHTWKQLGKTHEQEESTETMGNDEDTTQDSFGQNQLSSSTCEKWLNGKIFPDMSKLSLWLHEI